MMIDINRLAVITTLAEGRGSFGRTALMKYAYFLQTLRGVPLGYRFSLYSYGPFDSDVLADLDTAESVGGVKSTVMYFTGGYGYKIEPGERAKKLKELAATFLSRYRGEIEWVQREFGEWSPADLELASTLVYSDREARDNHEDLTLEQLAGRVNVLKPRYPLSRIQEMGSNLSEKGLLSSVNAPLHAFISGT